MPHDDKTGSEPPIYVIGDIHGHLYKLVTLLRQVGLVDENQSWSGADAQLWFLGDFADRGPDGIGTIDLVMRLQREAAEHGGSVRSILGNHDVLIAAASLFGRDCSHGLGGSFISDWRLNGGRDADLAALRPAHVSWLRDLPAMALVADRLLVHADSLLYLEYGQSIEEVNAAIQTILASDDLVAWDVLMGRFSTRYAFDELRGGGQDACRQFLATYGGRQILHGHTPIPIMAFELPEHVTELYVYAGGCAVNLDGGMFMGGPGFVHRLANSDLPGSPSRSPRCA